MDKNLLKVDKNLLQSKHPTIKTLLTSTPGHKFASLFALRIFCLSLRRCDHQSKTNFLHYDRHVLHLHPHSPALESSQRFPDPLLRALPDYQQKNGYLPQ